MKHIRKTEQQHRLSPYLLGACLSLSSISFPMVGLAQDESEARSGIKLEEIVVSARRREESLQDTPIAISAFSASELERRQINNTQDLDRVTPSLQFATSGQLSGNNSAAVVFIRGVGQLDPTAAVDPGVGIYIDEVYMGRSVGGAMDFRDISSVEVLRGPQGTLFGRNTIGGAILVKTQEPGDEFGGEIRLRTGDDSLYEGFAAVDVPISDELKSRFSVGIRQRDGYVTRSIDGVDLGDDDTLSFNGALSWDPSDTFRLMVRGDYTEEEENGSPFVFAGINENAAVPAIVSVGAGCPGATIPFTPVAPGDPNFGAPFVPQIDDARCANDFYDQGEFTNGGSAPVESTLEAWGLSATAEYDISDTVMLKSITAFRSTDWTGIRDADNTPFDILTTSVDSSSDQFSQELQLQFEYDNLTGITGIFYFDEETDDRLDAFLAFPPAPPVISSILAGGPGTRDLQIVNLETESYAAFSEWSYDINDALSVSGGLRYTRDEKTFQGTVFNVSPSSDPDPSPLPTQATSEGGPLFIFDRPFSDTYSAVTGSANVQYRWSNALSTYISYGQSFKSGGFNTRYNAPTPDNLPVSFDEETVETWEIGFKGDLADNLRINGALFSSSYDDIQLIFRQGVVPLLFNGGEASIDGFELEFTFLPSDNLIIEGGFSYLDDSIDSVTDVPGADATITPENSLPLTPEWQGNLGISYSFYPSERFVLTPRVDVSYTDSQFFDATNTELVAQNDSVTYYTGAIKLEDESASWDLTLGVDNLTDELFIEQGNASLATLGYAEVIYARPRNWFLQFSYDF